jgi:hypothetical protein
MKRQAILERLVVFGRRHRDMEGIHVREEGRYSRDGKEPMGAKKEEMLGIGRNAWEIRRKRCSG